MMMEVQSDRLQIMQLINAPDLSQQTWVALPFEAH